MATDERVDVPVRVPSEMEQGEYANAFRVLHDQGQEWLLDFVVLSGREQKGVVVSRLRIQQELLEKMRDRLSTALAELTEALAAQKAREGTFPTQEPGEGLTPASPIKARKPEVN